MSSAWRRMYCDRLFCSSKSDTRNRRRKRGRRQTGGKRGKCKITIKLNINKIRANFTHEINQKINYAHTDTDTDADTFAFSFCANFGHQWNGVNQTLLLYKFHVKTKTSGNSEHCSVHCTRMQCG